MSTTTFAVLALSIVAQLAAALIALHHARQAGRYLAAWICMSAALLLMIERRALPLRQALAGAPVDEFNALLGLLISLLMLAGIVGLRRLFDTMRAQEGELLRMARNDYLTGLANRRHFVDCGEAEVTRAQRYGNPLSLLMIDVDAFKHVNDAFGHDAGDKALKKLAAVCRRNLRDVDLAGRLGGEEFAVLLPETAHPEATEVAERLRRAVAGAAVRLDKGSKPLQITVSIGVATLDADDRDLASLLRRSDAALYRAKAGGRNQVCGDIRPQPEPAVHPLQGITST